MSNGQGRPPINIDLDALDKLLEIGATRMDCAEILKCSESHLTALVHEVYGMNFRDYAKKKLGHARVAIRKKQLELALRGSERMLTFLGAHLLGQNENETSEDTLEEMRERFEKPSIKIEVTGSDTQTVKEIEKSWVDQDKMPEKKNVKANTDNSA